MSILKDLYSKLANCSDFEESQAAEDCFLETLYEITQKEDAESISELIKYFNDESCNDVVMESLIREIEAYEKESYIDQIIKNLEYLHSHSPLWLDRILNRIFNAQDYREVFVSKMHLANKNDLIEALNIVKRESEHHAKFCDELIHKLKK